MTRQEFEAWTTTHGWTKDQWGHYHKGDRRFKLSKVAVRLEAKAVRDIPILRREGDELLETIVRMSAGMPGPPSGGNRELGSRVANDRLKREGSQGRGGEKCIPMAFQCWA